jgi:hypothetical protein
MTLSPIHGRITEKLRPCQPSRREREGLCEDNPAAYLLEPSVQMHELAKYHLHPVNRQER